MSAEPLPSTLPYVAMPNAFTPAELDALEQFGDQLTREKAPIGGADAPLNAGIRVSRTAWIGKTPQSQWLYDRMERVARSINERVYRFDLEGFSEPFQYTVYHDSEGGHYDWHVDQGALAKRRKLSFSVQLTEPSHYEGGDLQLYASNKIESAPKLRGAVIGFPAYVLHRVTPVTSGTRKSLVVWTSGPQFR